MLATALRIQRSLITRHDVGGVRAPPPIVSRIFQEISNGILAYNNATKIKEIPVPFGYVQFNALLLLFFTVLSPVAIACFTPNSVILSAILSLVVVGSFSALWLVANEMEDPFGGQANDMPMLAYHEEYDQCLAAMLLHPWLPCDQWLVADGKWIDPMPVLGAVLGAFKKGGDASSSNLVKMKKGTSLLDRSKLANTRNSDRSKWGMIKAVPHFVGEPRVTRRKPNSALSSIKMRAGSDSGPDLEPQHRRTSPATAVTDTAECAGPTVAQST